MPIEIITPAAAEVVTLAEAKEFLRFDSDAEDSLITRFVAASVSIAERYTNRAFITQSFRQYFDGFGCGMRLERAKVQSIDAVKYLDTQDTLTSLGDDVYVADVASTPATITLAAGQSWPNTEALRNAVRIEFTAGYGDTAADVPDDLRVWILRAVGFLFENRQAQELPKMMLNELYDYAAIVG